MTDLELELFEEYKSLDILLKDVLSSETGVSAYIDKMEENTKEGRKIYTDWIHDLKRLKTIRHKRNILAHEEEHLVVSEDDISYLFEFYNRVLADRDPLSLLKNSTRKEESKKTKNIVDNEVINTKEDEEYDEEEREDNSHIMTILLLVLIFLVSCFIFWAYRKMGGFPWNIK